MFQGIAKGQKGFTLVELLAVMAILAVLVAVVAPAVTGTRDASIESQVTQDSTQVDTAASSFFSKQTDELARTPHTILTTTRLPSDAAQGRQLSLLTPGDFAAVQATQEVVNKWPEKFITLQAVASGSVVAATGDVTNRGAKYANIFETRDYPVTGLPGATRAALVDAVLLLNKDEFVIGGKCFLERLTAIDFDKLVDAALLSAVPKGEALLSAGFPNFLWLFHKSTSSTGTVDDTRASVIMKLVKAEKLEGQTVTIDNAPQQRVKLTYKLVRGDVSECAQVSIVTRSPLAAGKVTTPGTPYSQTITAAGGTTAYTWSVIAGSLPTGLTAQQAAGSNDLTISGTPTALGAFAFTVKVTDRSTPAQTATKRFSISIQ